MKCMQSSEKSGVKVDASLQLAKQLKLIAVLEHLPPPPHKSSNFILPPPDSIVIKWQIHSGGKVLQGIYFGIEGSFILPWHELSWFYLHTVSTHPGGWTLFCLYIFPHKFRCCCLIYIADKELLLTWHKSW